MRQRIADRLKASQNTCAMLTTFNEIDMTPLIELRAKYKDDFAKRHDVKLGLMSPFVKASAIALKDVPVVNASFGKDTIDYHDFVDISVAVATPRGLVVPVIRDVQTLNLADIEKTIADYAARARVNKLTMAEMTGGTFTISNGGVFGSWFGMPIINPPQSAILGMHAIKKKPWVVDNEVKIRDIMAVALTYDHRLIDGSEAVTFLVKIKNLIEDPARMVLNLA
ncbi:2-oxoglutarate dehydrogenase E2 component (dihydrolipoamide succinyltransferase) [Strigomonas culicis]|uniref:dihydrolipoyllysine-residue succinyltransferase n=1 Tax=Strigomonas culicis TaxID=28005 RepID=S9UTY8_9TRYP|nr:2-oxoglutarate dehydrogenase E2 component (dihydrolipoamide succinyltransferase) [Strigomonas culicis]|eukprot:EPY32348.1 2-oxoglutarate dehydrogenase E2 component (dihydrolipoamide succinyltransferase) [Strigomonas culicis]